MPDSPGKEKLKTTTHIAFEVKDVEKEIAKWKPEQVFRAAVRAVRGRQGRLYRVRRVAGRVPAEDHGVNWFKFDEVIGVRWLAGAFFRVQTAPRNAGKTAASCRTPKCFAGIKYYGLNRTARHLAMPCAEMVLLVCFSFESRYNHGIQWKNRSGDRRRRRDRQRDCRGFRPPGRPGLYDRHQSGRRGRRGG